MPAGAYSAFTPNEGGDDSGDDGRRSPLLPTSHRQQHHDRSLLLVFSIWEPAAHSCSSPPSMTSSAHRAPRPARLRDRDRPGAADLNRSQRVWPALNQIPGRSRCSRRCEPQKRKPAVKRGLNAGLEGLGERGWPAVNRPTPEHQSWFPKISGVRNVPAIPRRSIRTPSPFPTGMR